MNKDMSDEEFKEKLKVTPKTLLNNLRNHTTVSVEAVQRSVASRAGVVGRKSRSSHLIQEQNFVGYLIVDVEDLSCHTWGISSVGRARA